MIRALILLTLLTLLTSCSKPADQEAQGYIDGRYTYIATSVSGRMTQLFVDKGDRVKQGQPLFILESQPESDAYNAALENLEQSVKARDAIAANLTYAKLTYERYKILVPTNAIQQSQLDNAQSIYNATLAQLAQADANIAASRASLSQAKWTKEQKVINAPVDGIVFDRYYRIGEYTEAQKAILSILAPADVIAIFYIPEPNLSAIQLGDSVSVLCDGCKTPYTGTISFISPSAEYTPPIIYSNETNEKLIYRIEAKFALQDAYKLHPGQPIQVRYTNHVK